MTRGSLCTRSPGHGTFKAPSVISGDTKSLSTLNTSVSSTEALGSGREPGFSDGLEFGAFWNSDTCWLGVLRLGFYALVLRSILWMRLGSS